MYATAYIVFTVAIAIICYICCVSPFTFFETKLWNYFTGERDLENPSEMSKFKRKESKPTIIDIGPSIEKSKYLESLKSSMNNYMQTKSFQT